MKLIGILKNSFKLEDYTAPKWLLNSLNHSLIPKKRVNFNINPVKIEKLNNLSDVFHNSDLKNYNIYIQRDDLNHSSNLISGNKIRKLEFIFADALINNCHHIITAGGLQSNHCRVVTILANMLNLKTHLFLRSHTDKIDELNNNGNLLLNRIYGANIYLIEKKAQYLQDIKSKMDVLQEKLFNYTKHTSYLIPIGGSNTIGLFGYMNLFDELITKHNLEQLVDDIIITCGSGGSMAGLAIGNLLTGSKFKIHAFNVCDTAQYFYQHLDDQLKEIGLDKYRSHDLVNIVDGFKGLGYGLSTNKELELIIELARKTGVLFDPVYTGKAFLGFIKSFLNNKAMFKGDRLLFIHTGGIFSHFDGRLDNIFSTNYLSKSNLTSPIYNCFYGNIDNINF